MTRVAQSTPFSNWVFTLNNYTAADEAVLKGMPFEYLLYGREVAPTTGTPHLQGYIQLKKRVRRAALCKLLQCHWEPAKGDVSSQDYCKKEGDYVELGTAHSTLGRAAPLALRIALNKRLQEEDIQDLVSDGTINIKEVNAITKARKILKDHNDAKIKQPDLAYIGKHHLWIHGPTGTGKSRKARRLYPDAYLKTKKTWWSNYDKANPAHEAVIIEEWGPKDIALLDELKVWADVYPFPAEIKGGDLGMIRPKHFVVTSNHSIESAFPDPVDHEPLKRRFEEIYIGPAKPEKKKQKTAHHQSFNPPYTEDGLEKILQGHEELPKFIYN